MLDDGCRVEGYTSDITRTMVLGKPTDKMLKVFEIVRRAQTAALAASKPGVPNDAVDAAARKVIVDSGYGPGFTYFTHRVGHGLGMDMHEWSYLVKNNMYGWPSQPNIAAGYGVQRRAGHLHPGRIWNSPGRRPARYQDGRRTSHCAQPVIGTSFRVARREQSFQQKSRRRPAQAGA